MPRARPVLLPLLIALALALAGCGDDSSSGGDLDKEALQSDISQRLAEQTGGGAPQVTCPQDLPAKVGATIRCRVDVGGTSYGITVTIRSTEGGNASYDLQVDAQ